MKVSYLGEGAGVLEEAGDQRDLVGVDGLAQDVVLGEAEELVIGVLGGRGVVVGDIHQRAGALLLAELGGLDDLGGGAGTGGEDADRVLVEGLGRACEELGGDLAVDVDVGRGGLDPILHRERVGPGAAAADEEDVGIALLADLVHGSLNLRTESEGIAHNLLVTRLIEIEHISNIPSFNRVKFVSIDNLSFHYVLILNDLKKYLSRKWKLGRLSSRRVYARIKAAGFKAILS